MFIFIVYSKDPIIDNLHQIYQCGKGHKHCCGKRAQQNFIAFDTSCELFESYSTQLNKAIMERLLRCNKLCKYEDIITAVNDVRSMVIRSKAILSDGNDTYNSMIDVSHDNTTEIQTPLPLPDIDIRHVVVLQHIETGYIGIEYSGPDLAKFKLTIVSNTSYYNVIGLSEPQNMSFACQIVTTIREHMKHCFVGIKHDIYWYNTDILSVRNVMMHTLHLNIYDTGNTVQITQC